MALAKHLIMPKSSLFGLNLVKLNNNNNNNNNLFCINPAAASSISIDQRRRRPVVVVAAISEDLVKLVRLEKPVTFKVRAVLTVRNKNKEDFTETIFRKLDAFADQIGRNVLLQLYSNDIDPSNPPN